MSKEKSDLQLLTKLANSLSLTNENAINFFFDYRFRILEKNSNLFKQKTVGKELKHNFQQVKVDDENYERRSIYDSTTIASKDEDESDFDELSIQLVFRKYEVFYSNKKKLLLNKR